jgi:mono/diheme cytochrome c family protein
MGDKKRLLDVVMHGLNKPIQVKGKPYNNLMPSFGFLRDEELAEVLTYIRQNFNNNSSEVTEKEVSGFREASSKK